MGIYNKHIARHTHHGCVFIMDLFLCMEGVVRVGGVTKCQEGILLLVKCIHYLQLGM